ncbi:DHHW family protein [Bilifractor sp. LCP19S3_H10]|uniref:DHHW family protein n=1 Tax=Bilifractor sp. LCP19S3_H10 TaxID=3438736 RepID=UPI003F9050FF
MKNQKKKGKEKDIHNYLKKNVRCLRRWQKLYCAAFCVGFGVFGILGLNMDLRPKISLLEKRTLAKLPQVSISGIWNGDFFDELVTWYSDTYPTRDAMLTVDSEIENWYGIRGTALYGTASESAADAIPDTSSVSLAPVVDQSSTAESITDGQAVSSSDSLSSTENRSSSASSADAGSSSASDASSTAAQSTEKDGTIHEVPDAVGQVYITGDRGFDIYYFNQENADAYASMINTVKSRVGQQMNLYDMIIPTGFGVDLSEDVQKSLGGSSQKEAIRYAYDRMDPSVKKVSVFDTLVSHNSEYLYFRTDHHWTSLGAYYAYQEFCKAKGITAHTTSDLQEKDFPGFIGTYYSLSNQSSALGNNPDTVQAWIPNGTNEMTYTDQNGNSYSYPIVADASTFSSENKYLAFIAGDQPYEEIHNPAITDGSSCLILKESFGNCFVPWLVDHYQNLYVIDYRYYNGNLTQFVSDHQIQDVIFLNNTEAVTADRAAMMLNLFP